MKPCRIENVRVEALPDGSAVLYNEGRKMAYPVSSTGARIWEICDGTRSVEAIVAELAGSYEADGDVIERDVRAFLQQLEEMELLEKPISGS